MPLINALAHAHAHANIGTSNCSSIIDYHAEESVDEEGLEKYTAVVTMSHPYND